MKKIPFISILNSLCILSLILLFPFAGVAAEPINTVPFNRFYRPYPLVPQVHLYSTDLEVAGGWVYEGAEWYIAPQPLEYSTPLYRLFNTLQWDHVYTVRETERSRLLSSPYVIDEKIVGHVLPPDKDIPGTAPLYRFSRAFRIDDHYYRDHFYSLHSTPPASYVPEGICCRVWKNPIELPDNILTLTDPDTADTWVQGSVQSIAWALWNGGGFIRIHYSNDDGNSWIFITAVPIPETNGLISETSYNWKIAADLFGKIKIKLEWARDDNATTVPWLTQVSPEIKILSRRLLPLTTR